MKILYLENNIWNKRFLNEVQVKHNWKAQA